MNVLNFCHPHREGRRASDGLVAQGILQSKTEHPMMDATIAFNSQRLHEVCKAKGVLGLHLLQKEASQLKTQYQANVTIDEATGKNKISAHQQISVLAQS